MSIMSWRVVGWKVGMDGCRWWPPTLPPMLARGDAGGGSRSTPLPAPFSSQISLSAPSSPDSVGCFYFFRGWVMDGRQTWSQPGDSQGQKKAGHAPIWGSA